MEWSTWTDALFRELADADLARDGEIAPVLAAFGGPDLLFLGWLRPFAKGRYPDPVIELCALALPLGADRLALCLGARAWSLDDPIPPVTEDLDARQRVRITTFADGAARTPLVWNVVQPFDLDGSQVRWSEPTRLDDGEGWIAEALGICIRERAVVADDVPGVLRQAERVVALGHELHLTEHALSRLTGRVP